MTIAEALAEVKAAVSPSNVLDFIKQRYAAFRGLGRKLVDMEHSYSQLSIRARAVGDLDAAARYKQRIYDIGALASMHQSTMNQIERLLAVVGLDTSQLGAFPVLPAVAFATALAIAATMVYLTYQTNAQQSALDAEQKVIALVEAGKMTPAEGAAYIARIASTVPADGFGSQVSKAAWAIGAVLLLWFVGPKLSGVKRWE